MSQENKINSFLEDGNLDKLEVITNGYHLIRDLVTKHAQEKELISINYKTELKSGVRLNPKHFFTNDGFLSKTIYSYQDKPVLEVSEKYNYSEEDMNDTTIPLSKKGVDSRVKTWRYYFENGELDTSGKEGTFKIKEKVYETDVQALRVGQKRRYNIQIILSQRVGTLLVVFGAFPNSLSVKEELRRLSKTYSVEFQEYEKYGSDDIYKSIEEDTEYPWFNIKVPSKQNLDNLVAAGQMTTTKRAMLLGALQAYDLTNVQGKTLRQYFIEKLKGNEK